MEIKNIFWQDNETKLDLFNYDSISKTIIELLKSEKSLPVSIGIHGDWGAGKSSILCMIEDNYKGDKETICIRFNGWLFQGFEDAKIYLLEEILNQINANKSLLKKAKDKIVSLHKRFNYIKLLKKGYSDGLTTLTGVPNLEVINDVVSILKPKDEEEEDDDDDDNNKWLKDEEEKSLTTQIHKFRSDFEDLLKKSAVKRFIVLIDDLDRCLPKTTIDILEAIKLLLFVPKTAFIIAADEAMIEYSVREHFPDLPKTTSIQSYTQSYLEKLIQIPFRIPALGKLETESYIKLLFLERYIEKGDDKFNLLVEKVKEKLKKPWENSNILDLETDIKGVMGDSFINDQIKNILILAKQMTNILIKGAKGNPRLIKRFLNSFAIRYLIAKSSGYESIIKENILLKLMLLERFQISAFEKLSEEVMSDNKGFSKTFIELETNIKENKEIKEKLTDLKLDEDSIKEWFNINPEIKDIDLRPYIFISRDKKRFLNFSVDDDINSLIDKITTGKTASIKSLEPEIKDLFAQQVQDLFNKLCDITRESDFKTEPNSIKALRLLLKHHKTYQLKSIQLLEELPSDKLGTWCLSGWKEIIDNEDAKKELDKLFDKWLSSENNILKTTISKLRQVNRR